MKGMCLLLFQQHFRSLVGITSNSQVLLVMPKIVFSYIILCNPLFLEFVDFFRKK